MNRTFRLHSVTALALLLPAASAWTQRIDVPRDAVQPPAPQSNGQVQQPPADPYQKQFQPFDATHLKDRPYSLNLPKPLFPSTDRVQREFVVEYIYDYALSNYTPEVLLPVVPKALAKRDTPEDALIAFFSAMRSGDYDGWLACWTAEDRKKLEDDAKSSLKHDAAFWKKLWADVFATAKTTTLIYRVETQVYVILDARVSSTPPFNVPTAFKQVNGDWLVSNDLTNNPLLYHFDPKNAGALNMVQPLPSSLIGDTSQLMDAQQKFLNSHTTRSRIVGAGK